MDELLAGDHVVRLGTTKSKIVTGTVRDQAGKKGSDGSLHLYSG